MTNKYLEKASGILSSVKKFGGDLTGKNVRDATKAFKNDKTKSFLELNRDLKSAVKDKAEATNKAKRSAAGAAGGAAAVAVSSKVREKTASDNKYLEKIAGFPGGILGKRVATGAAFGGVSGAVIAGKDNRIKGALAGATAGGVIGSIFGRTAQAKKLKNVGSLRPKIESNIISAGSKIGASAKLVNPRLID